MAFGCENSRERFRIGAHTLLLILGIMIAGATGCSTNEAATARLQVSPSSKLLTQLGATVALQATIMGDDGAAGQTTLWQSSDSNVARVDNTGVVTAVTEGVVAITAVSGNLQGSAKITVNTHVSALSAVVRYQDKQYSGSGFTGLTQYKPVRFALIELIDATGTIVQTTATDATGAVVFDPQPTLAVYKLRVYADTDVTTGLALSVHTNSGARYAAVLDIADLTTSPLAMDISIAGGAAGAFNILDVFTDGAQFIYALEGRYPAKLTGYWQASSTYGTYFCNYYYYGLCDRGAGIYVYSQGDTDEFDDDVLWHEFGHFAASQFSRDDSPGGCHYLSSNDQDLRLAWSEGWGDFFPAAVKTWLASSATPNVLSQTAATPLSAYIDTSGNAVAVYFDLGAFNATQYIYASNELAVARVLWRASVTLSMQNLWQVFTQQMTGAPGYVNLESLWDGWRATNPSALDISTLNTILNDRQIYYQDDAYEPDDASATRTLAFNTPEVHYLYNNAAADIDKMDIAVAAGKTYTLVTSNLRNGTDTYLRLRDTNGSVVAENDDYNNTHYRMDNMCGEMRYFNDGTSLASKIVFSAPGNGVYTLEVSHTLDPQAYPSTGRYGTYTLTVTEQ
ncbi:MAG: Ig-like domain-containing protein [Pseudomonadota bacterium]